VHFVRQAAEVVGLNCCGMKQARGVSRPARQHRVRRLRTSPSHERPALLLSCPKVHQRLTAAWTPGCTVARQRTGYQAATRQAWHRGSTVDGNRRGLGQGPVPAPRASEPPRSEQRSAAALMSGAIIVTGGDAGERRSFCACGVTGAARKLGWCACGAGQGRAPGVAAGGSGRWHGSRKVEVCRRTIGTFSSKAAEDELRRRRAAACTAGATDSRSSPARSTPNHTELPS
jgi:hypothetical protein